MRNERLYLGDISESVRAIGRILSGKSRDDFLTDEILQYAVLLKLIVIGEAVSRIPETLKAKYPQVNWPGAVSFRNRAVHAYFSVDWEIVWEAATKNAPELGRQTAEILEKEFPGI